MANAIGTYTIGSDLRFDTDYLFEGQSFVAIGASPVLSTTYMAGKTDVGLEIVGKVATEIVVEDTKAMTLTLEFDDNPSFTSPTSVAVYSVTASGATTLAADTELFRYAPTTEKDVYWRCRLVSTQVTASGTFDVYPVLVG